MMFCTLYCNELFLRDYYVCDVRDDVWERKEEKIGNSILAMRNPNACMHRIVEK